MKILKISLMTLLFVLMSGLPDVGAQSKKFQTRCGWFVNPTPSNYSLYDKDREWIISVQSGYQVEDFEAPDFKNQWIVTNTADYGHGCACLQMSVDKETSRVFEIRKSSVKPLSVCRKDKALSKWKSVLE